MIKGMCHFSVKNRTASIGVGAMVVFIALVVVAGIAASVIIQSSTYLESQAMATGRETTIEVATGVTVCAIEGYTASSSANISKLAILIRPRAGADYVDVSNAFIEICNKTRKVILNYTSDYYSEPDGLDNLFAANVFPNYGGTGDATRFGILVLEDADNSVASGTPIINRGDKVYLCINTTGVFNDLEKRDDIWGMIVPEEGAQGVFDFNTPGTYEDNVMELYWDM
jgi:flagellin FlaB